MSKKFNKRIEELDELIREFSILAKNYPKANYGAAVHKLQTRRAELTSQIGRNKNES